MSITEVKIAKRTEWSVNEDEKGNRRYVVPYYVVSDDGNDGPLTVLNASGLPARNATLSAGNDTDAEAVVVGRRPSLIDERANKWVVFIDYSTEGSEEREDKDGNATDDPTQWAAKISKSTATYSKESSEWIFVPENAAHNVPGRNNGEQGPVCNSVGVRIDPQPLVDDNRAVFRFTKYFSYIDAFNVGFYENKRNADRFNLVKWHRGVKKMDWLVDEGEGWLKSIDFEEFPWERNGVQEMYWKVTATLDVKTGGWYQYELDRGKHARLVEGDADGHGGTASTTASGVPELRQVQDGFGNVIVEDVRFNGRGYVLESATASDVLLRYELNNKVGMAALFNQ